MEREGLDSRQAFDRLRVTARSSQRKVIQVATDLVEESGSG